MNLIQGEMEEKLPQFMTTTEAAKRLEVTRRTLYRYIHREKNPLPVIYLANKSIRIPWEQFNIWIKDLEGGEEN